VPVQLRARPILDLETFAILTALYSLQRFISGTDVTLLTDSRVLFYLFSAKVHNSSVKIKRWCLKLLADYPRVTLRFVRTTENLADFLTREGMLPGDREKFNLKKIEVTDFYKDLPKCTFTLAEWAAFVEANPHYLTVNRQATVNTVNIGLNNIQMTTTPLEILKEKLSRSKIVEHQKKEFSEIYTACLTSKDFDFTNDKTSPPVRYKLILDLLMVDKDFFKILIPPSMVGLLLSHTHLLGHKGLTRMMRDLTSYWFPTMNTVVKKFISSCYSCFLSYKGSRKQKIGIYPTPTRPCQEMMMDLIENLNKSGGYSHLLVLQCLLSDFVIIVLLKSKTAAEITRGLLNSVFQQFNVEKLHSDNGPGFRHLPMLATMSALGVKIIASLSLHPAGRGKVERLVGIIKLLLKKFLATRQNLNWEYLPYLISKILHVNNTISPKTGYKPAVMLYGSTGAGDLHMGLEADLPVEISKVLLHDFRDLLTSDFLTLTKLDSLEIPNSISLYDPDPENMLETTESDSNTDTDNNEQNTWELMEDETDYDEVLRGMDKIQIGDEVENLEDDDMEAVATLDSDSDDSDNDTPGQGSRNLRNRTVTWDL
jgi:hypothetical protein